VKNKDTRNIVNNLILIYNLDSKQTYNHILKKVEINNIFLS